MEENFTRLNQIMNNLIDKHIKINMTNNQTLKVYLKEILPTELIVSSTPNDKKVGIISINSISYILEIGDAEWQEEEK